MISADPSALSISQLYGEHHGWLVGWLRKQVGCPHHAADLAHDTFVRIIGARDLLCLNEPRAYLTTTATRLLVDQARRRRVEQAYLAELALLAEAVEGFPSPEQTLVAIQALDQICVALDGLAEKPLQAFLLHYLDGQTHAEIALQLGVSARMIRKYLVQALLYCHRALGA